MPLLQFHPCSFYSRCVPSNLFKDETALHPPKKPMTILLYKFLLALPETNSSPLYINGWKMKFLLGFSPIFNCKPLVSGRVVPYIHPGKLTAGSPKNHPSLKSGKSSEPNLHSGGSMLILECFFGFFFPDQIPTSGPCECRGGFC